MMKSISNLLGQAVLNVHRQDKLNQLKAGIVVSCDVNRMPLIGVDEGKEFLSWIPVQDLAISSEYPQKRVLDSYK